jgi:hypothetical protein
LEACRPASDDDNLIIGRTISVAHVVYIAPNELKRRADMHDPYSGDWWIGVRTAEVLHFVSFLALYHKSDDFLTRAGFLRYSTDDSSCIERACLDSKH